MAKNDEERLNSFLNLLFGIDTGAILFFLVVKGDKLGEAQLPFRLAFYPFKTQVVILGFCACCVLLLQGANLFWHDKEWFQKLGKRSSLILLFASLVTIVWGALILDQNPDLLPNSEK